MRKISSNRILPVSSPPLVNGIISLDDEGRILSLTDTGGKLLEEPRLEFYRGIIVPGFVHPWLRLEFPATAVGSPPHKKNGQPQARGLTGYNDPSQIGDLAKHNHPSHNLDLTEYIDRLDRDLQLYGVRGGGLVIPESMLSDDGLQRISRSSRLYHPVIELCPGPGEEVFDVFHRGIEWVTHAWNHYNLSCSLTACPDAEGDRDLARYLQEYRETHRNVVQPVKPLQPLSGLPSETTLVVIEIMRTAYPGKTLLECLPDFTMEAARAIFEEDELGSIEPGKKPGLNLLSPPPRKDSSPDARQSAGLDPDTFRVDEGTVLKVLV